MGIWQLEVRMRIRIKVIFKVNVLSSLLYWVGRPLPDYGGTLYLMISHRMRFLRRPPLGHTFSFFLDYMSPYRP